MTRPAATSETWKCFAIPTNVPDGPDDANVAFTTRSTETTVMYHRRRADQFFGFSMSSGLKSSRPSWFLCSVVDLSRLSDRYGFAVGRDRNLSIRSCKSQLQVLKDLVECGFSIPLQARYSGTFYLGSVIGVSDDAKTVVLDIPCWTNILQRQHTRERSTLR